MPNIDTPPVFVVSTGRCGSTMVSNMARLHPRILSVSEFLACLADKALVGSHLDGEGLYERFANLRPVGKALLRNNLIVSEYLYPVGQPGSRFGPRDVPAIMGATLPHLSDDPEALWDELVPVIRARGRYTLQAQYRFFFEWLAVRLGKDVWIERSGASILSVPTLARLFPDARFVHVYRDGRDTAISMRGHYVFRMYLGMAMRGRRAGMDSFSPRNWPGTSRWVPWFTPLVFRGFDAKADNFRDNPAALHEFGWLWSSMIERGTRYLDALPKDRVLNMRFETVLESPKDEMRRFAEFVGPGFVDEDWLERITLLPRKKTPSWMKLTSDEHARLAAACTPGQRILEYAQDEQS